MFRPQPRRFRIGLALALIWLPAGPLQASGPSRQLAAAAFQDAYNLEFAASDARLEEAARLDPADPAPERAMAAITWMELLFSQGAATFEAFTGQASKSDVPRPAHWGGLRVVPETVEFWQGRRNRMHDRLRFRRDGTAWVVERLAP